VNAITEPGHLTGCHIYLFIYYMVYTHVKSFTIVKNRKCDINANVAHVNTSRW